MLPSIEVIALDGEPTGGDPFEQWKIEGRLFFASIGEPMFGYSAYKSGNAIISLQHGISHRRPAVCRVYLLGDSQVREREISRTEDLCNDLQPWIALLGCARRTDQALHALHAESARSQRAWEIRNHFRLYASLLTTFAEFSGFSIDVKEAERWQPARALAGFVQIAPVGSSEPGPLKCGAPALCAAIFRVSREAGQNGA